MIKLIVFDWDDVFTLGSTKGYYACYHYAITKVGVNLEPVEERKRIASKWGSSHQEEIKALLLERPELVDEAVKYYEDALFGNKFVDELTLQPGAIDLIKRISNNYTLAISSGVHPKLLKERIFIKFNIPNVFSEIITAYDLDDPLKAKPHPHTLRMLMDKIGVNPDETLMVGDALNDIKMAKAAGTPSVAVLTGHMNKDEAKQSKADYIIQDVSKLDNVILR